MTEIADTITANKVNKHAYFSAMVLVRLVLVLNRPMSIRPQVKTIITALVNVRLYFGVSILHN